jgi:hypothetical protein
MLAMDLARDFAVSAQSFADTFIQYIAPQNGNCKPEELLRYRREGCAALWAASVATFEASALTDQEKVLVVPIVRQELLAAWNKHCAGDAGNLYEIAERSTHYLRNHDRSSQLLTATNIVNALLEAIDPEAARAVSTKRLTAMIAHRMLSDLKHLNEVKARYSIE